MLTGEAGGDISWSCCAQGLRGVHKHPGSLNILSEPGVSSEFSWAWQCW